MGAPGLGERGGAAANARSTVTLMDEAVAALAAGAAPATVLDAAQDRAKRELAAHVRIRGRQPSGDLARDAERITNLRGWR